jgi:hypothetical protein
LANKTRKEEAEAGRQNKKRRRRKKEEEGRRRKIAHKLKVSRFFIFIFNIL